jgi:hypothetical protein
MHALPSGAPQDVSPRAAKPDERARFCVWLRAEIAGHGRESPSGRITGAFQCDNGGAQWRFGDEPTPNDCDRAPLCDVPFAKIEACLRSTFLGPAAKICREGVSAACDGLLPCLPYLERRTLP